MSRTTLTAQDVKTRFPEFASVDDKRITFVIEECARDFDADAWNAADMIPALRFLVAHNLVIEGVLSGASGAASGPITSKTLGDASETYADPSATAKSFGGLKRTGYGQRFLELARKNRGSARLTSGGV